MHNHAPQDYLCPFCILIQGKESADSQQKPTDIVFQDAEVAAFMATRKYPNNHGHMLVIPNEHYENIYALPYDVSVKIHALSKDVALAMKSEYHCGGVMLRQHNEPAGDQSIWHYHLHVIPRYENDNFHNSQRLPFEANKRAQYANKLKNWFGKQQS